MSLLSRLRERRAERLATATLATLATHEGVKGQTVATIATVAVANPLKPHADALDQVDRVPLDTVDVYGSELADHWMIYYADRPPREMACSPEMPRAEVLECYPGSIAAVPQKRPITAPAKPLAIREETIIREWLALIAETDSAAIAEVIGHCQRDADARDYFAGRAAADNLQKNEGIVAFDDDRRTCDQCANLIARRCQAAWRGEIVASRTFEPIRDLPRRCEGYVPGTEDTDRRLGLERWPGLIQKGDDHGCA